MIVCHVPDTVLEGADTATKKQERMSCRSASHIIEDRQETKYAIYPMVIKAGDSSKAGI